MKEILSLMSRKRISFHTILPCNMKKLHTSELFDLFIDKEMFLYQFPKMPLHFLCYGRFFF